MGHEACELEDKWPRPNCSAPTTRPCVSKRLSTIPVKKVLALRRAIHCDLAAYRRSRPKGLPSRLVDCECQSQRNAKAPFTLGTGLLRTIFLRSNTLRAPIYRAALAFLRGAWRTPHSEISRAHSTPCRWGSTQNQAKLTNTRGRSCRAICSSAGCIQCDRSPP